MLQTIKREILYILEKMAKGEEYEEELKRFAEVLRHNAEEWDVQPIYELVEYVEEACDSLPNRDEVTEQLMKAYDWIEKHSIRFFPNLVIYNPSRSIPRVVYEYFSKTPKTPKLGNLYMPTVEFKIEGKHFDIMGNADNRVFELSFESHSEFLATLLKALCGEVRSKILPRHIPEPVDLDIVKHRYGFSVRAYVEEYADKNDIKQLAKVLSFITNSALRLASSEEYTEKKTEQVTMHAIWHDINELMKSP